MPVKNLSNMRVALLLGWLAAGLLSVSSAWAGPTSNSTITTSFSRTPDTFSDTELAPINTYSFQTRLLGLLQGNATLFYDQTFAAPFGDATVTAGVTAAMAVLTTANAGDPLSFIGPMLDSSVQSLLSSNTVTTQVGDPLITETVGLGNSIGPDTIRIGDLGNCSGLVMDYPFGCMGGDGALFNLLAGTTNVNINTNSQYLFTREIQTTDSFQIFDTYRLIGVPQAVSVPEPGTMPLLALGLAACLLTGGLRRARRLS